MDEEQTIWYEVLMARIRSGDDSERAIAAANHVVDEYRKKFQTNPPVTQG